MNFVTVLTVLNFNICNSSYELSKFHHFSTKHCYFIFAVVKFRKLVTWAASVEIQNRKYRHEIHDSGFRISPFHVNSDNQKWKNWLSTVVIKSQLFLQPWTATTPSKMKLFSVIIICHDNEKKIRTVWNHGNHHAWWRQWRQGPIPTYGWDLQGRMWCSLTAKVKRWSSVMEWGLEQWRRFIIGGCTGTYKAENS